MTNNTFAKLLIHLPILIHLNPHIHPNLDRQFVHLHFYYPHYCFSHYKFTNKRYKSSKIVILILFYTILNMKITPTKCFSIKIKSKPNELNICALTGNNNNSLFLFHFYL